MIPKKYPIEIIERIPRKAFFHVAPRYTCGSPAMIDLAQACHIADGERNSYETHLTGVFGEHLKTFAEKKGLGGIAYARWEKGGKVWRLDLLTGEEKIEPARLSWAEREKVRELRQWIDLARRSPDKARELALLEARLEIHREEVK